MTDFQIKDQNSQQIRKIILEKRDQLKTLQEKCELQNKKIKLLRKENQQLKSTIEKQNQIDTNLLLSSKELSNNNTKIQNIINQLKQQILSQGSEQSAPSVKIKTVSFITLKDITVNESTFEIDLPNQELVDEEFVKLQSFPQLKILIVNDNLLSNQSVQVICKFLISLEKINLANNKFQAKSLSNMHNLKNLVFLDIRNAKLGDQCLQHISKNTNLRQFSVCKNNITDNGLRFIQNLENLNYLDLTNNQITDEGTKSIIKLKNLNHLYLMSNQITKLGVGWLMKDLQCQVLDVRFNSLQNEDKEPLRANKPQNMHFFC